MSRHLPRASLSQRKSHPPRLFRPTLDRLEDRLAPAILPPNFTESAVATGLSSATAMEFAPNGDLWVLQQGGVVKRFQPGSTTADVVGSVAGLGLSSVGERGLLGIAFDPEYASTKHVYLYYTATTPNIHNRISRFTVNDSNANDLFFVGTTDGGTTGTPTQTVILDLNALSSATNHNGGAIHFGPDGKLYVAVGDNAQGSNAQTLGNLLGKMLRINRDGTIPTDNPFFNTATGVNRAIWALGLRNPYTFTFQPGTGRMFVNDVGQSAWEEINDGIAGSNYGWPANEGNGTTPPGGPGTLRQPFYAYPHGGGTFQGRAITGGAFYDPTTPNFPASFVGDYFFGDYVNDWINVIDVGTGVVEQFATGALGAVDLRVTNDGSLYYLARDANQVFRVRYAVAPAITQQPANASVPSGGTATFTVAASGTAPLSYQWQKLVGSTWTNLANGGSISGATTATLTVSPAASGDAGQYRAVVSNTAGSATSNAATLTVTAPSQDRKYDFGTATSPVAGGFTRVTPASVYSASVGHGWLTGSVDARDRGQGGDLNRDFNFTRDATFAVDLPAGTWTVAVTMGDATGPHDQMGVFLEGAQVDTVTTAQNQFVTRTYTVTVSDGQLTLRLRDLGGGDANVVINALEVNQDGPPPPPPPPPSLTDFDFGTADSPVAAGFTRVTEASSYSAAAGYGWLAGAVQSRDRGSGGDLNRDFNFTHDATFAVDLANGTYTVTVTMGDQATGHDLMGVFLEGAQVDSVTAAGGQFVSRTYTVTVSDGQLTLRLRDLGGFDANAVINALVIEPV